jgi:hypothetical protein
LPQCNVNKGLVCLLVLLVGAPLMMMAQVNTADILGTATDSSGAVVPGVKITAKNAGTAAEYTAVTDSGGNYMIRLLPSGRYSMRAEASGFKAWTTAEVALAVGDRLRQEIRLEVGQVTQTVEVTAEAPALQSDSSALGNLLTERAVQDLPLMGRNFVSLAQLTAGANDLNGGWATGSSPDDRRRTSAVSVNAQGGINNNFLMDGMDNNERFISSIIVKPSIEAMAEMKVQTNMYSAELGRVAGGVVNIVTKSGTNRFHGSAFEFFRNEKLDGKNFFTIRKNDPATGLPSDALTLKPPYKQNQFGASLGGPIVKNRTFFFGDYEEYRVVQGVTLTSTVPTVLMKQGIFTGVNPIYDPTTTRLDSSSPTGFARTRFPFDVMQDSSMDRTGKMIANLWPDPLTSGVTNNYQQAYPKTQNDKTLDTRVDHRFSESDILFGRYSFNDTKTFIPGALPVDLKTGINPVGDTSLGGPGLQRAQNLSLSETHTFTARLVGEFKFAYSRIAINSLPPNYGINVSDQLGIANSNVDNNTSGMAQISASGGYRSMGDGGYIPLITFNNLFQPAGSILWARGAHSIKIGGDLRRRQVAQFQSANGQGSFSFNANFTMDPSGLVKNSGNSVASLLTGYPASTSRNRYLVNMPGYRLLEYAAFFQDDWRATRWLTLNLGLRYDYFSPVSEATNRIANLDVANIRMVIAGQDGVSNTAGVRPDRNNFAPRFGFAANFAKSWVLRGGFGISFMPWLMGSNMAFRNPPFVSSMSITTATPGFPINRISDGLPPATAVDPLNPTGSITAVAFDLLVPYVEQWNLTLQKEFFGGFVGSASYVGVLGRKARGGPGLNNAPPGPGAVNPRRPYYGTWPLVSGIDAGRNGLDSSYNALQLNLERRFAGGVGIMANYTWAHAIDNSNIFYFAGGGTLATKGEASGDLRQRFTLTSNYRPTFAKNAKGLVGALGRGWQLNLISTMQTGTGVGVGVSNNLLNGSGPNRANQVGDPVLPKSQRTLKRWYNTDAFQSPAAFTYGNAGPTVFRGPGKVNFDVSVSRDFSIREELRLQFRAEGFNITNTPQFGNPSASVGSTSNGQISSAGDPRRMQLALKLMF